MRERRRASLCPELLVESAHNLLAPRGVINSEHGGLKLAIVHATGFEEVVEHLGNEGWVVTEHASPPGTEDEGACAVMRTDGEEAFCAFLEHLGDLGQEVGMIGG